MVFSARVLTSKSASTETPNATAIAESVSVRGTFVSASIRDTVAWSILAAFAKFI